MELFAGHLPPIHLLWIAVAVSGYGARNCRKDEVGSPCGRRWWYRGWRSFAGCWCVDSRLRGNDEMEGFVGALESHLSASWIGVRDMLSYQSFTPAGAGTPRCEMLEFVAWYGELAPRILPRSSSAPAGDKPLASRSLRPHYIFSFRDRPSRADGVLEAGHSDYPVAANVDRSQQRQVSMHGL